MTSLDTDIALVRRHTLGDLLHRSAARFPYRVAITDGLVTRTYEGLDSDANRLAHALIERGVAIVVPRPGVAIDVADLRVHARARVAPFKVPKAFALVEAMPKNASGKLLKRDLRDLRAHLAAEIDGGRATAASGASPTGGDR